MSHPKILTRRELLSVPVRENNDPLVWLETSDCLAARYLKPDMIPLLGHKLAVRGEVAKRLHDAAAILSQRDTTLRLVVVYGYRAPEVQGTYFDRMVTESRGEWPTLSDEELFDYVHPLVADPSVAGHPTGGAVDVLLETKQGEKLDFGCDVADFSVPSRCPTCSPDVSSDALRLRILLRDVMSAVGFAPFDGEWWHFSYGDREWSLLTKSLCAMYSPIALEQAQHQLNFR